MKIRWFLIGLAVAGPIAAGDEPKSALKPFTSAEGNFSILLPGKPTLEKVTTPSSKGGTFDQIHFTINRPNGAYMVTYQENPGLENARRELLDRGLMDAANAVNRGFGGKFLSSRKIELEGKYPGLEYVVEVPAAPGLYRSRMYMVNGRLFQLIVVGTKEFITTPEAAQILDSFKLVRKSP